MFFEKKRVVFSSGKIVYNTSYGKKRYRSGEEKKDPLS